MTHRSYERPLITEIYSEVHFEPTAFAPPLFFDLVPHLKQIGFEDVQFGAIDVIQIDGEQRSVEKSSAPRVRCWSADKQRLIQLAEDMIAVNLVAPYPGWATYRDLFAGVRSAVVTALGLLPVESLSLNTIDRLVAPRPNFRLGMYLNCGGPKIPESCSDVAHAFDLTMGVGLLHEDGFNRQVRISGRPSESTFVVFINAVFHDRFQRGSDLVAVLDNLHEESVQTFEAMITDLTRNEVMGGSKHVASA